MSEDVVPYKAGKRERAKLTDGDRLEWLLSHLTPYQLSQIEGEPQDVCDSTSKRELIDVLIAEDGIKSGEAVCRYLTAC